LQKAIQYFWWLSLAGVLALLLFFPSLLSVSKIQAAVAGNFTSSALIYFALCTLRALTLIPATTFFIAGMIVFKDNFWLVYFTMVLTVMLSSYVHYEYAHILGFDSFFKKRFPKQIDKMRTILNKKNVGFWTLFIWGITPFVPSDLMYYVAGIVRMKKTIFFTGIFLAVCTLFGAYILFWNSLKNCFL
jgi:uncharacterized membrane protein YdjX (TVP38/TMEM64 family)